ncbi:hypothetical protein BURK2_01287 [Burkholderiales bacterium]|nr:hypothetical protein BURK2_01287 [Burkholderiales bacterium]
MKAAHWLLAYLLAVVAVTLLHDARWLAALLVAALVASGPGRWAILRRGLLAVLAFNLTVSLGYVVVALGRGVFSAHDLLLVNLRVVLLAYLGFWFVSRVNLLEACRFSPTLGFVVTLAAGQIETFARALRDFRLAFQSRNLAPPTLAARARHASAQAAHLLDKSVSMAAETALAMRSRGCFDDYGALTAQAAVPPTRPLWRPVVAGALAAPGELHRSPRCKSRPWVAPPQAGTTRCPAQGGVSRDSDDRAPPI